MTLMQLNLPVSQIDPVHAKNVPLDINKDFQLESEGSGPVFDSIWN
jgi:hypothetical protein